MTQVDKSYFIDWLKSELAAARMALMHGDEPVQDAAKIRIELLERVLSFADRTLKDPTPAATDSWKAKVVAATLLFGLGGAVPNEFYSVVKSWVVLLIG